MPTPHQPSVTHADLLAQIIRHASQSLDKSQQPVLEEFIRSYYTPTQLNQLLVQSNKTADTHATVEDLAGVALHHFSLLQRYQPNSPQVAVFNPNFETDHFHSPHSIIQMVAYDRPFLVDTLLMSLEAKNITVQRLHHTIVAVEVDEQGNICHISHSDTSDRKFLSLIHCEIARQTDESLADIRQALLEKIDTLDIVVSDWQAMREQLMAVKAELQHSKLPSNTVEQDTYGNPCNPQEIDAFLAWILDNNFIFLGYREYRYAHEASGIEIYRVNDTGLGLLTDDSEAGQDRRSDSFHQLPKALRNLVNEPQVILLSKSQHLSPIHRPVYMDFLGIQKFDSEGRVIGEHRFIGLLTANAYQLSVNQIPMLRKKVESVLAMAHLPAGGHAYNKFEHILNTLPRDDLFQASSEELYPMVMGIANLNNKHRLRLFARIDHYQRFVSCLVFIPRDKFNTQLRQTMQQTLVKAFNGESSGFSTAYNESYHARVHVHVRTQPERLNGLDLATLLPALEQQLTELMQGWSDSVEQVFINELGEVQGRSLVNTYVNALPLAYQEDFAPRIALSDIQRLEQLKQQIAQQSHQSSEDTTPMLGWYLYQTKGETAQDLHLKVYGNATPATLSHILPILENFGLNVISSQTYELESLDLWMQAYAMQLRQSDSPIDMAVVAKQVEQALGLIWQGVIENDPLNELVLTTPLDGYEVTILRALSHYMRQAKAPFSLPYIKQTLIKYPELSVSFVQLFHAKMRPTDVAIDSEVITADVTLADIEQRIDTALKSVQTLDEDRILRWVLDLLHALLRTNYYQRDEQGQRKNRLSLKFSAKDIPNLPKPKPMFEIFVYSPKVEAVHLRGGKVARGGLRWSDRMEDFRTEVLGLVKAQMVKNAVIVPVGSKGGFIVKTKSMKDGRDAYMAEGIACYQTFIRGMLDITDNLVEGQVVPPANTVRHDGDDPYLVVAADKGTATFSDIANAISADYHFWLGDAFASGGSVGYDHKAMGITAKGAWESVKRHFRLLGKDIQNPADPNNQFTVVGIGDMSGDVFGNGMLLSPNIQLVAAFNHLHIFIDPTPNTQTSFAERERLFNLPRSTWDDYNKTLISQGGGVFSRQDKGIAITPEMKSAFAIEADSLTPDELIHALLKAPVDLLWNGGIGTYVKSQDESHADVGDRANDAVRIDGQDVRAKVIGEGGNLGMTQRGRIEYAQNGGHLYTDAIDNSAGVNCSDHEVNIKILLGSIVAQGDMTTKQRNDLLASMTNAVGELVLRQNYLQPQAIELSAKNGVANLSIQQKFMQYLESQERLDRAIEFLPSDDEIARRQKAGQGLTNPELSVLLAYGKMWVYDNLLASDVPDDSYFVQELRKYFPDTLSEQYFEQMTAHPLHREIVSTYLTNSLVNRLGIDLVYQLFDETDVSVGTITRAYSVVRDVFGISRYWQMIESLDNQVDANLQLAMENQLRDAFAQSMYWILGQFGEQFTVTELTERLTTGVQTLLYQLGNTGEIGAFEQFTQTQQRLQQQYANAGLPEALQHDIAQAFAILPLSAQVLDTVQLANKQQQPADKVASVYFAVYDLLGVDWLLAQTQALPQHSYWERRAVQALRGDILQTLRDYVSVYLSEPQPLEAIAQFAQTHKATLAEIAQVRLQNAEQPIGLATLSVVLSELKALLR